MQDNSKPTGNQSGQNSNQKPSLSWSQPAVSQPSTVKTVSPAPVKTSTLATTPNSNAGTYVGIFVAGIILGALIGWGISSSNEGKSTTTAATSTATMSTTTGSTTNTTGGNVDLSGSMMGSNSAVTIASTQTAGYSVEVSKMSISQPTWLVVYENHSGTPGNAIGAGLFFAGMTSGSIELLRATTPGSSYLVGQSVDDGDKTFSMTSDKVVSNEQGKAIYTQFTAK